MKAHRHGWECFKTSGGFMNALESHRLLTDRIEQVYKTAYRTGYKNALYDAELGLMALTLAAEAIVALYLMGAFRPL